MLQRIADLVSGDADDQKHKTLFREVDIKSVRNQPTIHITRILYLILALSINPVTSAVFTVALIKQLVIWKSEFSTESGLRPDPILR